VAEERVAEGGTRLEASVAATTQVAEERVTEGGTRLEASVTATPPRWLRSESPKAARVSKPPSPQHHPGG
jgi:hypothetical protein